MYYWIGFGIPTVILLIALIYAVNRAGWFSPREERQLDANTRMAQERDDPDIKGRPERLSEERTRNPDDQGAFVRRGQ
jgi:hypothetical protein